MIQVGWIQLLNFINSNCMATGLVTDAFRRTIKSLIINIQFCITNIKSAVYICFDGEIRAP